MKDLEKFINENKTTGKNIQEYGKSWTIEWTPDYFVDMLKFFVGGISQGLEDNLDAYKNDVKKHTAVQENIKLINDIKKLIEEK